MRGDVPRHDSQPRLGGEDVDIQPDVGAGVVEDVVLGMQGEAVGHRLAEMLRQGSHGGRRPDIPERWVGEVDGWSTPEAVGGGVVRDDPILAIEDDDGVAQVIQYVEKVWDRQHWHVLA